MGPWLNIASHDNGERLDAVLARTYPRYSRVFFQKFMRQGGVTLSGVIREPSYRVRTGEKFLVADFEAYAAAPATTRHGVEKIVDFIPHIIHEDKAILIIDKPAGLVVHPAPGHRVGTLMDWLKNHLGSSVTKVFTDPERLGLVHRLDKDTSGVLVIAKSVLSQTAISRQFHDRTVNKTYVAFIEGVPSAKSGVITAPLGRSRKVPTRMEVSTGGRPSETAFELKENLGEVSQVSLYPKTGRTHQIRVHLAAIGHPIVGDRTYGAKSIWIQSYGIKRSLLHAEQLELNHPTTGKRVTYKAPWPADFKEAQSRFRDAFKAVVVLLVMTCLGSSSVRAQESASGTSSAPTHKSASHSLSRVNELSSEVHKLQKEVAALKEKLEGLEASIGKLDVTDRVRDMEQAVAELNAKAVGTNTLNEEVKTQMLDMNRKLKTQQDMMEQLRDQVDRLKRQLIEKSAVDEPSPAPAATTGGQGSSR